MASVDPTAVVRGDVELADDVQVGPGCVLDGTLGRVAVGAGTRLYAGVFLCGPIRLGTRNTLYPGAALGFAPQSRTFDSEAAGCGLVIGNDNVFREYTTVHRAMTDEGPTTIGNDNYIMAYAHAGHDCQIDDHCTIASSVLLAGHVHVNDNATIGGGCEIHQFCHIGRGVMASGGMIVPHDVPPFMMLTGPDMVGSINIVGMRRLKFTSEQIEDVKWIYKILYRRSLPHAKALDVLRERADRPLVAECIEFFGRSTRGPTPGRPSRNRA